MAANHQPNRTRKNPAAAPGPTAAEAYETRHIELLKGAAALFAERGFHRSSIRDLSRSTGRSLAGLYYYFSGKEELLFQIQHHCYGTLLHEIRRILAGVKTPREKLITFIGHHIAYFRHNMNEMKVLAHEDLTLTGTYMDRIVALKREYSKILIDIVAEVKPVAGGKRGRPAPEVAAFLLFGMMNWLYTWPRRLRNLSAEDLAENVAQIFLCGYPGCSESDRTQLRENLVCSRRQFWKRKAG